MQWKYSFRPWEMKRQETKEQRILDFTQNANTQEKTLLGDLELPLSRV